MKRLSISWRLIGLLGQSLTAELHLAPALLLEPHVKCLYGFPRQARLPPRYFTMRNILPQRMQVGPCPQQDQGSFPRTDVGFQNRLPRPQQTTIYRPRLKKKHFLDRFAKNARRVFCKRASSCCTCSINPFQFENRSGKSIQWHIQQQTPLQSQLSLALWPISSLASLAHFCS